MKYIYPLSLLLLLISCQKEEKKVIDRTKADWAFYKLEGDVKNVTTKSWLVNDKLEKIKTQHEDMSMHDGDMVFDENGLLVSEKFYINEKPFEERTYKGREKKQHILQYINGNVGIKTDYGWDQSDKNNTSITRRNPDNTQIDRIEMKYQNDKITEKITYNNQNNPTEKIVYTNDKRGNVIEELNYQGLEIIQYKSVKKYDDKNRILSDISYDKKSKKLYETVYEYKGNNLTKKYTYDNKGKIEYSEDFTYDAKGNMLTQLVYEKFDNSKTLNTYTYDSKGNRTQWAVSKNGKPFMTAFFKYDAKGNTTVIGSADASCKEKDKREYEYEYDKTGNWIKKTIKINGTPQYIAERQINYID